MVRSTCKKKHFKKRNNQTIKLWGGGEVRPRSKCPYCEATFANLTGVYPHCANQHPTDPPPTAQLIRSMPIPISSSRAAAVHQDSLPAFNDIVAKHMAMASAAVPAASAESAESAASAASAAAPAVPVAVRSDLHAQRLERMRPHPFVNPDSGSSGSHPAACGANVARNSNPKAVASMAAAAHDKYPIPITTFQDPITFSLMFDPVIACDGYTYERAFIVEWFKQGNMNSPITRANMSTILIPNLSLRSAISQWADAAAVAQAASSRARAAIVAATAHPSTKVRPASY